MTIAALLLPFALLQADAAAATNRTGEERYNQCVASIDDDAERAYEEGMAWASEGNALGGYRCAAIALVALNRFEEGARRLESLAVSVNTDLPGLRADLFSQAGNAWLLARDPAHARSAFTRAIATVEHEPSVIPDLLIDRARAYAMEGDYRHAEEDFSRSLDIRPDDPLALRLRAAARMNQRSFQLAETDAMAALAAARTEEDRVDAALVLGHVRESARTGAPVEPQ